MEKLNNLTRHLRLKVDDLKNNPERLVAFAEGGKIECHHQQTLSFGYGFNAVLIFTDMSCHTDFILVPLLDWVRTHETELAFDAIRFISEPLSNDQYDLRIEIPLTQRVIVTPLSQGGWNTDHPTEHQPEWRGEFPIANND